MEAKVPLSLIASIKDQQCGLFVGAGISMDAGLPSWPDLLSNLIARLDVSDVARTELYLLVRENDFLTAAEFCLENLRPQQFHEFMFQTFRSPSLLPTINHRLLPQIPFSCVATTNYDRLLEEAYSQAWGKAPLCYSYRDIAGLASALGSHKFFILKAHGDIDQFESIVLRRTDYQKIMFQEQATAMLLRTLLVTRPFLFIGYSLRDPDFMLLIEYLAVIFNRYNVTHYALLPHPGEIKRRILEKSFNIQVIPYTPTPGHPQVTEFLNRIVQQVAASTAPVPFIEGKDQL
jgi:NAD-dependent SIR2 family protein deacetylase